MYFSASALMAFATPTATLAAMPVNDRLRWMRLFALPSKASVVPPPPPDDDGEGPSSASAEVLGGSAGALDLLVERPTGASLRVLRVEMLLLLLLPLALPEDDALELPPPTPLLLPPGRLGVPSRRDQKLPCCCAAGSAAAAALADALASAPLRLPLPLGASCAVPLPAFLDSTACPNSSWERHHHILAYAVAYTGPSQNAAALHVALRSPCWAMHCLLWATLLPMHESCSHPPLSAPLLAIHRNAP